MSSNLENSGDRYVRANRQEKKNYLLACLRGHGIPCDPGMNKEELKKTVKKVLILNHPDRVSSGTATLSDDELKTLTGALQAYETTFDPNYCGLTDSISLQDEPPPREHRDDAPGENARQALLHILPHVDSSLSQVDFVSAVKDAIANDHKKARKLRRLLEQYETDVAGDDSESESSASDGSSPRRSLFDDLFEREEEDSYESPPTSPLPIVDLTGSSDEEGPTSRKRVNSDGEGEEIPRRRARRLSEDQEGEGPSAVSDVEEEAWPEEDEEPMSSYQPHSPTPPSSPEPMSSGFARPWPTSPSLPPSPQPIRSGSGRPPSDYFSASQASQPATGTSQPTPEKGLPPEIPPLFQDFLRPPCLRVPSLWEIRPRLQHTCML
ncbi:LT^ [Anguilla marmorata adomavirus 1]|uniref:LT n=1 Tax=Anguilla marmorata adomavirus 1 TaxID=2175116 RepID=A0A2S1MK49_9VIRU|nr:LT^ [Anguilla marmorata adomavirus 1]